MLKASDNYKSESLKGIGTSTDLAFIRDRAKQLLKQMNFDSFLTPVPPLF